MNLLNIEKEVKKEQERQEQERQDQALREAQAPKKEEPQEQARPQKFNLWEAIKNLWSRFKAWVMEKLHLNKKDRAENHSTHDNHEATQDALEATQDELEETKKLGQRKRAASFTAQYENGTSALNDSNVAPNAQSVQSPSRRNSLPSK